MALTAPRVGWRTTSVSREPVTASDAPAAVGPYSHAVAAGGLLFCSGQLPLDPVSGELLTGPPAEQARRCLDNLSAVCSAAGTGLDQGVKITIYLVDMNSFGEVNEVYASYFTDPPPARVAIGVAALPRGAQVEIDAIVALSG
jgi:2-iminobutanoate/2-iminopropanoate deaminase